MKNIFRNIIIYLVVLSFAISNSYYSFGASSDALRSKSSAHTLISHDIAGRFLNSDIQGGEDGFVFFKWDRNPDILASGKYGSLSRVSGIFTNEEATRLDSMLKRIKDRLLKEDFFCKEDFNLMISVVYPAYKSATYDRRRDTIIIDSRSFENEDFLYLVIKHELTDRKLPGMPMIGEQFKEFPGLRELFTLITVNIAGFMGLRRKHPRRAKKMLEHYRPIAYYNRGLFRSYDKIIKNPSVNTPLAFTEDILKLVESEKNKTYFPNMRKAIRKLAIKRKDGTIDYESTSTILKMRLTSIYKQFFEMRDIKDKPQFRPLTDFKTKVPISLKPFMPYAENIDYEIDDNCVFLRIRLKNSLAKVKFAYLYIGLDDNWDSILGKRGKIYGLVYDKWKKMSPGIFRYRHDGIEKERGLYWNRLIRFPITKLIDKLSNNSNEKNLRRLFAALFNELGIKSSLSNKKWFSIKKAVRGEKAPNSYYVINNIIWKHIDRVYPKLFLGRENLQGIAIADIPAWLVTEDHEMGSKLLSWLNPRKKLEPLSFYEQAERISARDILKILQETASKDTTFYEPLPKISDIHTLYHAESALYLAA